jgi:outer membrane protein, heavy metal efflux system
MMPHSIRRIYPVAVVSTLAVLLISTRATNAADVETMSLPPHNPTLGVLVRQALENHPSLSALDARHRAALEGVTPARTWPDPQIMVGLTNVSATNLTLGDQAMSQLRLQVSQRIPWRGTLELSADVTERSADIVNATIHSRRNNLAADVTRAGLGIYHVDRRVEIERAITDMLRQMADAIEPRVAVGTASQDNFISITLEADAADARLTGLMDRRFALVASLEALLGDVSSKPLDSIDVGPIPSLVYDVREYIDTAYATHPVLARIRTELKREEVKRQLSERRRIPDPTVSASYGYRGDMAGVYSAAVGVSLPIWMDQRQNAQVRMSTELVEARRHEVEVAELSISGRITSLIARIKATDTLRLRYTDHLIPNAHQAVDAASAGYVVGRTGLIDVLDSVRRLHMMRLEALKQEVSERVLFVYLEEALGSAARIADGSAAFTH